MSVNMKKSWGGVSKNENDIFSKKSVNLAMLTFPVPRGETIWNWVKVSKREDLLWGLDVLWYTSKRQHWQCLYFGGIKTWSKNRNMTKLVIIKLQLVWQGREEKKKHKIEDFFFPLTFSINNKERQSSPKN